MILKYLRWKEWALVALCVILIAAQVYADLEIPDYMSSITDTMTSAGPVEDVVRDGAMMLGFAFASLILSVVVGFIAAWIAASLSKRLREMEFSRVESFSLEEMNRFSTSSLITRSTNDITQVQMAVAMGLQVVVKAPIMAVWAITKIANKNWEWTVATAVVVVIMLLVIGLLMVFVVPRFKRIQWLTDDVNRATRENLTGVRVVRAYNAESYQEGKFAEANGNLTRNNLSANRAMSVMFPTMTALMNGLSLSIYWIGAIVISEAVGVQAKLTLFSDMIVFSSYAMQIVMAFIMMVVIFMILPRATISARRIEEVIDTEPSIRDGGAREGADGQTGTVSFRDVSFGYPGSSEDTLSGISFDVARGETVAFIGSTGSGKTSLVNLIPRFYDASKGTVEVDGRDVREYDLDALRSRIGYVPQKAVMFTGTIDSNVRYGDTSGSRTEEQVRRAISIAQASEFVDRTEEGIQSPVSQGGTNLSGGQKQRVSIARAVCRDPEIYIFDDSFSALDYRTDRILRETLRKETAGVTTLIVAQRIGTIMDADRIIVLDEGRIAGMGSHRELLETCDVYRDIARSQLSEEELAL